MKSNIDIGDNFTGGSTLNVGGQDLCNNATFVLDGSVQQFDITHGKLGDKWLVSCMGCLTLNRGLFYRVVPADQSFHDDYCGLFRFRIWWCGEWKEVVIDDLLPTVNNKLVFIQFQHSNQFWASLLEKAYAKLHGSYEALKYGTTLDGLSDFTGGIVENIDLRHDTTSCNYLLNKLLSMTCIITCLFEQNPESRIQSEKLANGITIGMNYQLVSIEKVDISSSSSNDQIQLVRSPDWNRVDTKDKEHLNYFNAPDCEFWMPYNEFVKTFSKIEVVHLDSETSRDEPSLRHKTSWNMKLQQGSWQRGVTAGGCRNHTDTFHINPQYQLILPDIAEIIVSVNQHSVLEPKVIGFSCYPMEKNSNSHMSKAYFKKQKSLVSSPYTNNRQVSHRCKLEAGGYVLVPTTFEPGEEASFTLRVYSMEPIKLKFIDFSPSVLKQSIIKAPASINGTGLKNYESIFFQASNEHKTVNAFELHELLEACLPNAQTKGTGRIGVTSFNNLMYSLKYWQSIFRTYTKGTTGILKAERLRDSLADIGFQLNTDVLSCLVLRYMRKDGTLRFGDFVSCILHLTVAFANFEKKDALQNGYIKLGLAEVVAETFIEMLISVIYLEKPEIMTNKSF
ncbi:Calpain-C [Nymphon striatum]|nr:Calpain-C [Nymphon striatum]